MEKTRMDDAQRAAACIKRACPKLNSPEIGVVLGTGWGGSLQIEEAVEIPFSEIPGFSGLQDILGHSRCLIFGYTGGKQVLILDGRIHLNESPDTLQMAKMVRLQVEMLFQLGVEDLIVTSAGGALGSALEVGEIALIDGFVSLYAPPMPLWAGEFCSPEDTLCDRLKNIAIEQAKDLVILKEAGYAMVPGPNFEGRKYDKKILAATGAGVVGMSTLPEACIAALYEAEVLALSFVTNDTVGVHSHQENIKRAKEVSGRLGQYLTRIIQRI